jgi:hypothetical protein
MAKRVMPELIEKLSDTKEDHSNTLFSLIGTFFIGLIYYLRLLINSG